MYCTNITVNAGTLGQQIIIDLSGDGRCNGPGGNCNPMETIQQPITPVTLSSVMSEITGSRLNVNWVTSSELFNVGFQLWGLDGENSKWGKLHNWLVRSGSGNAVEPQSYSKSVKIPDSIKNLVSFGISSVDSDGTEHYYGPFNLDQSYGNLTKLKPISWSHIRDNLDAKMRSRGYIKDRVNGYRKIVTTNSGVQKHTVMDVKVSQSGMYRITVAQLLAAGLDWRTKRRKDIAVLNQHGQAVVRYVSAHGDGNGLNKTLGDTGELYFYGQAPNESDRLYTDSSVYRLMLDPYQALDAQTQSKQGIQDGYSKFYQERAVVEDDSQYVLTSAADDPWLSQVLISHSDRPRLYGVRVPVEADALWNQGATLRLGLGRSSALTVVDTDQDGHPDPEHIVEGLVLSSTSADGVLTLTRTSAVGSGQWLVDFPIPANTPLTIDDGHAIVGGAFSAGSGYEFSEIHVDNVSLDYARPYLAKGDDAYLHFNALEDGELGYEVVVPDTGWPWVFGSDGSNLVRIAPESHEKRTNALGKTQRVVRFAALATSDITDLQYWVSGKSGYLSVIDLTLKSINSQATLLSQANGSDLLIISHPVFIGDTLKRYAQVKQSQGYKVAIIDYLEIVDSFGGGQPGPQGLTDYLAQVKVQGDLAHVLLVGGSSYDHTDKLGTGAITFIPGHYEQSNYSLYTVSDVPYIMDATNELFASIGRWPVRSGEDLQTIVDKSINWSNKTHGDALLIAEQTLAGEQVDFGDALADVASNLPTTWRMRNVDVDTISAQYPTLTQTQVINQARNTIIEELNNTPDVVLFNGHATTSQFSNKGLFSTHNVSSIVARGAEVWLPMSCYVTFYESIHVNTLAHQLLFKGNAVNISGAMLLSNQDENIAMGRAILNSTVNNGESVGEAVNAYKSAQSNNKFIINWATLGDPTTRF